jgi:hypothetical protein
MILYWETDYRWGFTTMDNTAEYTASSSWLTTPHYLRVAGINPLEMKVVASEVTAQQFRLFRPGGKSLLGKL